MTREAEVDYEEWVENVAQSVAILLSCMREEDRQRILNRVQMIAREHEAARHKRHEAERLEAQRFEAQRWENDYQQQERIFQEQSQQAQ